VENGHTVPSIETLEKLARALEVPMYQLFYDGEAPPEIPALPKGASPESNEWGSSGESAKFFQRLRQLLGRVSQTDRKLILHMSSSWFAETAPDSFSLSNIYLVMNFADLDAEIALRKAEAGRSDRCSNRRLGRQH